MIFFMWFAILSNFIVGLMSMYYGYYFGILNILVAIMITDSRVLNHTYCLFKGHRWTTWYNYNIEVKGLDKTHVLHDDFIVSGASRFCERCKKQQHSRQNQPNE